jgi:hypothetical protein
LNGAARVGSAGPLVGCSGIRVGLPSQSTVLVGLGCGLWLANSNVESKGSLGAESRLRENRDHQPLKLRNFQVSTAQKSREGLRIRATRLRQRQVRGGRRGEERGRTGSTVYFLYFESFVRRQQAQVPSFLLRSRREESPEVIEGGASRRGSEHAARDQARDRGRIRPSREPVRPRAQVPRGALATCWLGGRDSNPD